MPDPLLNVDFEPLYYDVHAAMDFLWNLPGVDALGGRSMDVHVYWKTVRPFERKQLLPIKSFIATQELSQLRLHLWSNEDLTKLPILRPWLPYLHFHLYRPELEARDTVLEGRWQAGADDALVYSGGDVFRALILHKHGGVYVDMDSVFLRDLRPVLAEEFMYKWSFQRDMISSAVMHLRQRSDLSQRLMQGLLELPQGGTNWGCQNNMRAYAIRPFRVLPCAFFNPEWQVRLSPEEKASLSRPAVTFEPFEVHEFTKEDYPGSFVWHWHNRWDAEVKPGCKFERLERRTDTRLRDMGLLA